MKSMTGYGAGKSQGSGITYLVSLRSVNGRFLEMRFQMPSELYVWERELREVIQKEVHRGRLTVFVERQAPLKVVPQKALAQEWLKALKSLSYDLKMEFKPDLNNLLQVPDLIQVKSSEALAKNEKSLFWEALFKALRSFQKERQREGRALEQDLKKHLRELKGVVNSIQKQRTRAQKELRKKLEERAREILKVVDTPRLEQEVGFLLERSDISEEITRLKEHIRHVQELLKQPERVGKKLDFYFQELLREVNTIGSKSQFVDLTVLVVEAKDIIEKLREQVQNVE